MSTPITRHEPLMRIVKRDGIARWKSWTVRGIAVLVADVDTVENAAVICL